MHYELIKDMFYIVFTQENSLKTVYETNYNRDRDQGGIKKKNKTKRRKLNNREVSERFNRNLG